jgi:hypothetical protein
MENYKIENLNKELEELETRSGIIGSAVVKRNGLLIASKFPRDHDPRKIGALAASMLGAIETAAVCLDPNRNIFNTFVELDNIQLVIFNTSRDIIFVALINLDVNLGLVYIEIEETIKKIENILKVDE